MLGKRKGFDILSLLNFSNYQPPEETGKSFEENAILKAVHAASHLNILTLADDSGLVVPALNGEPGIFSSRYAGPDVSDKENRQKLLEKMKDLTGHQRSAHFFCALALADPNGLKKCVTGTCEGVIVEKERGGNGFGYDPLFLKNDYGKTFSELEEETKNRISHRRKAVDKILLVLESL